MNRELNEKLARAITDKETDYDLIKKLIMQGADPLGPIIIENETPISELFCSAEWKEYDDGRFPKIMQMFLENGFECTRFLPEDEDGNHSELWTLLFAVSEGACQMLKLMLDNGLSSEPVEDFVSHFFMDSEMCDGSSITLGYLSYVIWALKMVMLCASYPQVLDNSGYLRDCIECNTVNKDNTYSLENFRNNDDYDYEFDFSTMDNVPNGIRNTTVTIIEKKRGETVWTLRI